ncbi:hypothetical protein CK203_054478 [Vitis vinifera]|uniref:Endonuclease/exonuclease/phosphatase domain-containing protein n=1 Tax=Vitis vinifera TaxID=29760 RepID=A0A438GBB7_VITVI|nr:hypothetical protein CK203_054478 [Vitis vinifera]
MFMAGKAEQGRKDYAQKCGSPQRSYAKVVRDEGPRKGGLVPVGRWARAVVCECQDGAVNWVEADRAMARRLGHKGVVTIVPFAEGKGLFFVETLEKLYHYTIQGPSGLRAELEVVGTVTEIDWRTLKLFDLSKARVKVVMKERSVLPALIEVVEGWDFTVSVAVAVKEEGWQVREMVGRTLEWRGGQKAENAPGRTRGKNKMLVGYSWSQPPLQLDSKRQRAGSAGPKQAGGAKAHAYLSAKGKVKSGHEDPENQQRDSAMKRVQGSCGMLCFRQALRLRSGNTVGSRVFRGRNDAEEGTTPTKEYAEQRNLLRAPCLSKGKEKMRNTAKGGDRAGLNFEGYCGMTEMEILEVSSHHFSQPYLPFHSPFSGVAPSHLSSSAIDLSIPAFQNPLSRLDLLSESCNYVKTNPSSHHGAPILGTASQGDTEFSQMGGFQIEGLSSSKMAKEKRRVVKDFLRLQNPDVVMLQETKREVCDRRFVGSVWSVRNKEWVALLACGASGGILIIWDSKKMSSEDVVIGSFSVSVKFLLDGCGPLWLSAVYGPNSPLTRKDFWVELSDLFGLTSPSWCVGGDFNVIRRSSEKLGGSRFTSSMRDLMAL